MISASVTVSKMRSPDVTIVVSMTVTYTSFRLLLARCVITTLSGPTSLRSRADLREIRLGLVREHEPVEVVDRVVEAVHEPVRDLGAAVARAEELEHVLGRRREERVVLPTRVLSEVLLQLVDERVLVAGELLPVTGSRRF